MTLIDRQIETIALACAVTPETVRAVIDGQRVGDSASERVRAALSLSGYIAPIPKVAMPVTVNPHANRGCVPPDHTLACVMMSARRGAR